VKSNSAKTATKLNPNSNYKHLSLALGNKVVQCYAN